MNPGSMEGMFNMMNNPDSMKQMEQMMKNPEIQKLIQNEDFMESMMNMMGGGDISDKMFNPQNSSDENTNIKYEVGHELKLTGLKTELNYNDQIVKVVGYNTSKQRYEVEFLNEEFEGKHILVKETNLYEIVRELEPKSRTPSPSPPPPPSPSFYEVN